jgi:hypothetical protein
MVNREEAIQEVSFIKKLLDATSKQIIKSGSAFIWVGLVMYLSAVFFQFVSDLMRHLSSQFALLVALTVPVVIIVEVVAGLIIYRRTVSQWSSATLEKQIWQIWTWALMITLLVFGVLIKRTAHNLSIGVVSISPDNMNIAILVALAATGVLTNKSFFYKLTVCCIILNWLLKFMPEAWRHLSLISGTVNLLLPLWGTGIYFLWQKRKSIKEGITNGLEQSAGSF